VFEFSNVEHNARQSILDSLQLHEVMFWHADQKRMTVIDYGPNEATGHSFHHITWKRFSYVSKSLYVEIRRFADGGDVLVE
jgi:hypothetical protein